MSLTRTTLLLFLCQTLLSNAQSFRSSRRTSSVGRIVAGVVVGCLVLIALLIFFLIMLRRRRRLRNQAVITPGTAPSAGGFSGFGGFSGKPMFGGGHTQTGPYNNQYNGQSQQPYYGQPQGGGYGTGGYGYGQGQGQSQFNTADVIPPSSPPPYGTNTNQFKPPSGPPPPAAAHTTGNQGENFVGGFKSQN
ncbi:hypothetical protein K435DRAFT_781983 [Dendrothele bispora CBS 962.96]|uniref:Uncharacterized protein n=1 Tax=Dendrothele bispora (strain CBS 962.96) TaxID=1314807 RepID=A0A4S8LI06_DENBC|nr:hypothetical protein K435DRAFT_781983 [Dendrothele bispora CBS 962.96]